MAGLLATLTLLSGWAVLLLAQDTFQNCIFSLVSDGSILGQIEGGQVVGTPKAQDSSAEASGTIFRLRGGGLYDTGLRGCWWPEPSTVLVCSLQPPAYPAPLFALDGYGHLVYNATRRDFWACPADLAADDSSSSSSSSSNTGRFYYYLDPPMDMQRDGDGGLCRRVGMEAGVLNGVVCNMGGGGSSSFSSSVVRSSSSSGVVQSSSSSSSSGEETGAATTTTGGEVVVETDTVTLTVPGTFETVTVTRGDGW